MNFQLTINSRNAGKKYDATNLIDGDVTWTTARSGSAGKLTFTVIKHGEIIFHEGDQVRFSADGTSFFLGYIFIKEKKMMTVCCLIQTFLLIFNLSQIRCPPIADWYFIAGTDGTSLSHCMSK